MQDVNQTTRPKQPPKCVRAWWTNGGWIDHACACFYTWPFGLSSTARACRARAVPTLLYMLSSRHSTSTEAIFRAVPARGTTGHSCRASPQHDDRQRRGGREGRRCRLLGIRLPRLLTSMSLNQKTSRGRLPRHQQLVGSTSN
jgi:hypothetical protein